MVLQLCTGLQPKPVQIRTECRNNLCGWVGLKLQLVQIDCCVELRQSMHINLVLQSLHWLLINFWVQFKAHHGPEPTYLQNRLSWYIPLQKLPSSEWSLLKGPPCKATAAHINTIFVVTPNWHNGLHGMVRKAVMLLWFYKMNFSGGIL